jgi:hypothetical protein
MSPFSRPSQRAKAILDENTPKPAVKAATKAIETFLETQQLDNTDAEALEDPESAEVDQAQFEHDTLVVQSMVFKAIEQLFVKYSIAPTKNQLRDAQAIMPAVRQS